MIITETANYIRNKLSGEHTGHDWFHTKRVWDLAKYIGKYESADLFVVELSALLHDIADWKFASGDESVGPQKAREWLLSLNLNNEVVNSVCQIIQEISFRGSGVKSLPQTIEGKVVQDADRLDAIGAIGIARTFAYGGAKNQEIYNPNTKTKPHNSFDEYKNSKTTTINHFYEKLLLLKGLMNTKTAKIIAQKRHDYMENFLNCFLLEWNGMEKIILNKL